MRTVTSTLLASVSVAVVLTGCTTDRNPTPEPTSDPTVAVSDLQPMTLREALEGPEYGEQVRLSVALVTEGDVPFLCDAVDDSDPEQCADPNVEIVGAPLEDLDLVERSGERSGEVDLIVLLVDEDTAEYVSTAP
ncbi:hypothetical protein OCAE111667_08065 [Occultella aeris]|uniref:Lipoprotein n=1 Tax=Occultella aeris TaxID=2761496 RepID=A0A7M4DP13_9MICO|nr:hypothetical protein [Occultella aeris]VZO39199.1 hypothetical protein HALOF300_03894 [Occultella aeris]